MTLRPIALCLVYLLFISIVSAQDIATVSAAQIVQEFQGNEFSAKQEYGERRVAVAGRITKIFEDSKSGNPCIMMDYPPCRLIFVFEMDAAPSFKSLRNGVFVVIEGLCKGTARSSATGVYTGGQRVISFTESVILDSSSLQSLAEKTEAAQEGQVQTEEKNKIQNPLESIVTIEGKKGSGTGFIANYNNRRAVITNLHLLFDNEDVVFYNFNGQEMKNMELYFAQDRDIAVAYLPEDDKTPALTIAANMTASTQNANIIVYGNSLGDGVNTTLTGVVKAIGPKAIEVTAPFVPGNSGSPIIEKESGFVLGVATELVFHRRTWATLNSSFAGKPRRMGTRIDNLDPASLQIYKTSVFKKEFRVQNELISMNLATKSILDLKKGGVFMNIFRVAKRTYYSSTSNKKVSEGYFDMSQFQDQDPQLTSLAELWNKRMLSLQTSIANTREGNSEAKFDWSIESFCSNLKKMRDIIQKSLDSYKKQKITYTVLAEKCEDASASIAEDLKDIDCAPPRKLDDLNRCERLLN